MEKKLPGLVAQFKDQWQGRGQIRVLFQDEARFGRISDPRRCWCPRPICPTVMSMVTQEYCYAYAAVSPADGEFDALILPHVNSDCMQIFLDEISLRHIGERVIMIMDGAGWHKASWLRIPPNIRLAFLPPHIHLNLILSSIYGMSYVKNPSEILYSPVLMPLKVIWNPPCWVWSMIRQEFTP